MTLAELSERLRVVDADSWKAIQGYWIEHNRLTLCDNELLDTIQGEIQRAIQQRGYPWLVVCDIIGDDRNYWGAINVDPNRDMDSWEFVEEGDSPAEALLAAYLQAIEEASRA
jgi:hypothetical protein